jgi:hypothetical protein
MGSEQANLTYNWAYTRGNLSELPPGMSTPMGSMTMQYTEPNDPLPAATGLQAINDIIRDTQYSPGYSSILDINRCPTYALPWLAQFVGVRFPQPQSDAVMRAAIVNESAFQRGTIGVIEAAANAQLISPYVVTVHERTSFIGNVIGYDPYAILVTYPLNGANSLTWGQVFSDFSDWAAVESAYATWGAMQGYIGNLETAVLNSVPAGIIVYFESV